jgi:hypothetical protein
MSALALSVLAGGCAAWSSRHLTAVDHLAFLSQALAADGKARETLWRDFSGADGSDDAQLRAALLQSLPNHSGTDLTAARQRLDALAAKSPASIEVASVARLRLAQMNEGAVCRDEIAELRQRLARVVDIERRLNQGK